MGECRLQGWQVCLTTLDGSRLCRKTPEAISPTSLGKVFKKFDIRYPTFKLYLQEGM